MAVCLPRAGWPAPHPHLSVYVSLFLTHALCVCVCVCVCVSLFLSHTHTRTHAHAHGRTHACTHASTHARLRICRSHLISLQSPLIWCVGSAQWLERWTRDPTVADSCPGRAAGEISSPGSTFCADSYFGICSAPLLPQ